MLPLLQRDFSLARRLLRARPNRNFGVDLVLRQHRPRRLLLDGDLRNHSLDRTHSCVNLWRGDGPRSDSEFRHLPDHRQKKWRIALNLFHL